MVRTNADSPVIRKNVLVTGGSGFLGRHVVDELLRAGHEVRIFDRAPNPAHPELCFDGDICEPQDCRKALIGMDVIMHLAALYRDDVRPRSLYYKVNVDGTGTLLDAASAAGIERFIFASSFSVYGLDNVAGGEDSQLAPVNDYGHSKLAAEKLVTDWVAADPARSAAIVRPSVIFGPGNRGNVFVLLQQIASKRFVLLGSGANPKSMSYVGNVAAFFSWLVERRAAALEIYNYADKPDMTVREIVRLAAGTLGTAAPRIPMPKAAILALGLFGSLIENILRRPFTINLERVSKFVANTSLPVERLSKSGFVAPFDVREKFIETADIEFGATRRKSVS